MTFCKEGTQWVDFMTLFNKDHVITSLVCQLKFQVVEERCLLSVPLLCLHFYDMLQR